MYFLLEFKNLIGEKNENQVHCSKILVNWQFLVKEKPIEQES